MISIIELFGVDAYERWVRQGFRQIQQAYSIIRDVRGHGLILGVDIVEGNGYQTPSKTKSKRIQQEWLRRGLIIETGGRFDCVIRFLSPLVLTRSQAQRVLDIFSEAVRIAAAA